MRLVAQLKLEPTPAQAAALRATMAETNAATNWVAERAFDARTFRQFRLSTLAYHDCRDRFALSADMTVRVIARVANAYASGRFKVRTFRPEGAIPYDAKTMSFRSGDCVSIWTVDGRQRIPFVCGADQRKMLAAQKGQSVLIARRGSFYLHVGCEVTAPEPYDATDYLGVDLGVVNIATDSDGGNHGGAELNGVRHRRHRIRGRLQSKGSRSAKRRLRQQSGREARHATDVNHCISKRIVHEAERTGRGIALEDLKGIRGRIRARRSQRRTLHSWAFFQLRSFIEYKAALAGVPVVTVDPAYTSRTCPSCGCCDKANRPRRDDFRCVGCGLAGPADHIAAINIGGRAVAMQPHAAPACG